MSDDMLQKIQNLPYGMTGPLEKRFKFFPTRKSRTDNKGYRIIEFPEDYMFAMVNIHFREKHGINTLKDFIDVLNQWGYNERIRSDLRYWGIKFNIETWSWYSEGPDDVPSLRFFESYENSTANPVFFEDFPEQYVYDHYDVGSNGQFLIYYRVVKEIPDIGLPGWLTRVNGYKYTPSEYIFRSSPNEKSEMFFGVELEVASKLTPVDLQYLVTQVEPKQEPFFYFKWDGSIEFQQDFSTFEIVTFPCSYRYLKENFSLLFKKLEEKLPDWRNYIKTDQSTGVHVHVSLDSFFTRMHLKKFVTIWNQYDRTNTEFIQKIGLRQFNNYCRVPPNFDGMTLARRLRTGVYAPGHNPNKYSACRETDHTAEVRIFRGGFDYYHIMYCLETVHAMHTFAVKVPLRSISSRFFTVEFKDWLADQQRYRRLKKEIAKCA